MKILVADDKNKDFILTTLNEEWGSIMIERGGEFVDASKLPAIVAVEGDAIVGLATLLHSDGSTEIMTINSFVRGSGVGSEMLRWIEEDAISRGANEIVVFTSNDNLDALRFYQRRGFRLERIWKDTITEARKVKTSIPLEGNFGIPCCDEVELRKCV